MNILVLGGTRFMGKHLVKDLIEKGYQVTIANRGVTEDAFEQQVTRLIIDRYDEESLKAMIPDCTYDVVFDTIAYCSNDVNKLLNNVKCKRYIQVSTASVYPDLHMNTKEEEFDPHKTVLVACDRNDFAYDEIKRQAECAIVQSYSKIPAAMVRFPYVIGEDDYTKRFFFYVDHIINQKPMYIDNPNIKIAFVRSDEAGKFLSFLATSDFVGSINAANVGTLTVQEIADYVKQKTGKSWILDQNGDEAPYNGGEDFSLSIERAVSLGYEFTPLKHWIYDLIDYFIAISQSIQ